jgi:hypothetical protein
LYRHFPRARIIPQHEASKIVERWLREQHLVRLLEARRQSPFMLKLTDIPICSRAQNIIILDSDVLFFKRPHELLTAGPTPVSVSLFQRDPASTYNISEAQAQTDLGIALAPQVNTGIALFARESLELGRCEEYLAHPAVRRASGWIEQTLHALCASDAKRVQYLPASYVLSLRHDLDLADATARHYAGPSRPLLTTEGMPFLMQRSFLETIGNEQPVQG